MVDDYLSTPGKYLFAAFIDFKAAFDSVNHTLLWQKQNAEASFSAGNSETEFIGISKGVLQGDTLSPLLFSLFLFDIERHLWSSGASGVKVNGNKRIVALLYADDLLLLADCRNDLVKLLNSLKEYSDQNGLTVNTTKSKVMIFSRSPNTRKFHPFQIGSEKLERVATFTFLGVLFSSSGKYTNALKTSISKGIQAAAAVRKVLSASKCSKLAVMKSLFNACSRSSALYAAEVWSPGLEDELECLHVRFWKKVFCWPAGTPGYIVRNETAADHIGTYLLDMQLRWICKTQQLEDPRQPKICLRYQLDKKLKWVTSITNNLQEIGYAGNLHNLAAEDIPAILELSRRHHKEADDLRMRQSTRHPLYQSYADASYWDLPCSFQRKRLLAQLRVASSDQAYFTVRKPAKIKFSNQCGLCRSGAAFDLAHFLECPAVQAPNLDPDEGASWKRHTELLQPETVQDLKIVNLLIIQAIEKFQ